MFRRMQCRPTAAEILLEPFQKQVIVSILLVGAESDLVP
jgi:hypothetical protein